MCGTAGGTIVAAMTETLMDPPPSPPPPPDPRRLVRDPDDKVVAGVCAAFGRYTDTDPVLWRVCVAVLALFGGAGLALYAFGWMLLPKVGEPESFAERAVRREDRTVTVVGAVLLAFATVILLGLLDNGPGVGAVLVLGGLAYLVVRDRRSAPLTAPLPQSAAPPVATPRAPRPPRERSPLGGITLSVAAVLSGVLLALRAAGADELTGSRVIAAALLVVGTGVLVGTWWGRARWLLPIGLVLTLALAPAAALGDAPGPFRGGWGERVWAPAESDGRRVYELGVGEATLDLRNLRRSDELRVEVGVGRLVVLVPPDLSVFVVADVRLGEITREIDGTRSDLGGPDSTDLHEEFAIGPDSRADLDLELVLGVGELEVRRVSP